MNDIKKIINVLYEISNFDYASYNNPKCIKLILGKQYLNPEKQSYELIEGFNPIYKVFKHFALVTKDKTRINCTEVKICSMLFNCAGDIAYWFLDTLKQANLIERYVDFLYFKHGIVMLNGMGLSRIYKNLFLKYDLTDLLILGENKFARILDYIHSTSPDVRILRITHPSPRNWHVDLNQWINCSVPILQSLGTIEENAPSSSQIRFRLDI